MEEKQQKRSLRRPRRRLVPIWLRLVIVFVLVLLSGMIGAMVGYGVLGDGNPFEALKPSTWQHIVDLIEKQ
ncbi:MULTISPECIES: DNA-directed RNA polymerase subunit beta [unclassified Anoxybacillus]|uniref:DNA-directed RNA polymerase subunit beta n=1 Tax=unclassified Anoxybacillus TaxID=2639704 RepID=UPI001EDB3F97|nr:MULTISPECIES: DNA-directed RNA polymerase subunit beta [unclassified Anoxybacillus]MCG3084817.1 DNA-directed RNA polymerase subunit beta [Anoxybacillus sp. LAT27]MCG5026748.1 DNA-directed RNA polymerase subunit beta [Anoxybacillus flavithermus]MCG6174544.1 DNA-directed RNA polymerase subunit beta [Anoxybacillus sp. LAT_31]MCG6181689.1 DNA-directed RNA polymerase subunit beta [Anoxybacillus sp. LAT_33]